MESPRATPTYLIGGDHIVPHALALTAPVSALLISSHPARFSLPLFFPSSAFIPFPPVSHRPKHFQTLRSRHCTQTLYRFLFHSILTGSVYHRDRNSFQNDRCELRTTLFRLKATVTLLIVRSHCFTLRCRTLLDYPGSIPLTLTSFIFPFR